MVLPSRCLQHSKGHYEKKIYIYTHTYNTGLSARVKDTQATGFHGKRWLHLSPGEGGRGEPEYRACSNNLMVSIEVERVVVSSGGNGLVWAGGVFQFAWNLGLMERGSWV